MRIAQALGGPIDESAFEPILEALRLQTLSVGKTLMYAGSPAPDEFFVLEGALRTSASDTQGRDLGITPVTLSRLRSKLKFGKHPGQTVGSHRTLS